MKRKFYLMNKQLMRRYSNDDTIDRDRWKRIYSKYRNIRDEIAKVYQIHAHAKFTVIVRSSFIRLYVHPTTMINPCYRSYFSSMCSLDMSIPINSDLSYNQNQERKIRPWSSFYQKVRQMIKDEVTSTLIIHSSTTQRQLSMTVEKTRSYHNFIIVLSFSVIGILIIGVILWYIFMKNFHSSKSTIRLETENDDLAEDDDDNNNQYLIERRNHSETDFHPFQSNIFNGNNNNNYFDEQNTVYDQDEKIDYKNIQILIENLQQSNLESVNLSTIGQIISDLIHQVINSTCNLSRFLSHTSHFIYILRSIMINKCSNETLNPMNFLQYQYLIEILHHSEFILTNLYQYHSHKNIFMMEILTRLYQILASMKNDSHRHQSICQSLFDIVEQLKT